MPNANIVLTEESLNCNVPVTQGVVIGGPASHFMTTPEKNSFINAQIASAFQPQEELWELGSHAPTTQPVVQLVPVRSPVNSARPSKGSVGESGTVNVQNSFPENCLSKQDSVYGNIQCWQHIKTLVQRHLSRTPDVSAFSCFLMFTEFESAEENENSRLEMENSRLEMMRSIKSQVLTITRQDPQRPPAPEVFEEPACNSMKTDSTSGPACFQVLSHRQLQKTEAPMEIPPEAMQEYMDIMDWLERLPQVHTGESTEKVKEENSEPEQKEDDFYSDAGVLSYIDELCSQKHFVEQVSCTWSLGAGQIMSFASQSL
ncbi:Protein FAM22 [Cricetulus griseus]|uniref:Protein FAM22 n=1 Tax=Cricetulus griseus TaxID=10029 RepID=G3IE94_CRIGR|nr:Protein FAM22 [Cricetulus griseus]